MMNLRVGLLFAAALFPVLGGCQQRRIAAQQMQEELRFQEDRIYQLEDWIRQYAAQLNDCRTENQGLRVGKATSPAPKKPLRIAPFGDDPRKGKAAPDIEIPEVEIPKIEIPKIETPPAELPAPNRGAQRSQPKTDTRHVIPTPAASHERLATRNRKPPAGAELRRRPAASTHAPRREAAAIIPAVALATAEIPERESDNVKLSAYEAADPQDNAITGITLSRLLTAPLNSDGVPGDDGIMVVVEPRNKAGELVAPAGTLSVVVIDRAAATEAEARIGRWDFSREETARLYRRTTLGDGIQLKLFWQDRQPGHSPLELHARLTTQDGRNLEVSRAIEVALADSAMPTAVEPNRLQPEPASANEPTPIASEAPAATAERAGPAAEPGLFQVVPIPQLTAAPPPVQVQSQPSPVVPKVQPRVAAAPTPRPRNVRPAPPPAEEQVAIPDEPGSQPRPASPEAEPTMPPLAKPQWAPYRKQK